MSIDNKKIVTKKRLLEDLVDSTSYRDWLEYSHIPELIQQLKKYKFTKKEIEEYDLPEFENELL